MTFWAAGIAIGGAILSSSASKKASKAQDKSSRDATAVQKEISDDSIKLQREQFDRTVELQEPFRQTGITAQNKLLYLMGLSPTGNNASDPKIKSIRDRLAPQFTTRPDQYTRILDGNALDAAVRGELNQGQGEQGGEFGSLARDFGRADFEADPGYEFRMEEGTRALDRGAAARGGLVSGRASKDLMRFGQGLGAQEYGAAFNRFQTNRSNKLNPLQSLMGGGQTATNTIGTAGQTFANGAGTILGTYGRQAGENIIGAGNARASGYVGSANAVNSGISQLYNGYQNNRLMHMFGNQGGGNADAWRTTGNGFDR